jgi:flavin reductase (DIM6/NTAB) family NADH-FMN oxidoreductase RutF
MVDSREFRNALGRFATGITVVTTYVGSEARGMTVNAFMSLSLEPPLVAVAISETSRTHALLASSERYGVSILRHDQQYLSDAFAGRAASEPNSVYTFVDGFPLLEGSAAQLLCRIVDAREVGDHTLFIGQVEHLAYREASPLLYYAGRYSQVREAQFELQPVS